MVASAVASVTSCLPLHQFVEGSVLAGHRELNGLGESGVLYEKAELDVAVLSAEGEVGAGQQHYLVVNDDELRVADHGFAGRQHGRSVDCRTPKMGFDVHSVSLVPVDVNGNRDAGLCDAFPEHGPHLRGLLEVIGRAGHGLPGGADEPVELTCKVPDLGFVAGHGPDRREISMDGLGAGHSL